MSVRLVTGGSRGIGRAVVELLASEGHTVAFTYRRDAAAAADVAAACGGRARPFVLDAAERDAAETTIRLIESTLGPIAGLVSNAGVTHSGLAAMTADADWDRTLDVNLGGAFRVCRAVLPAMISRRAGAIVLMSSLGAVTGAPGQAAYAASKAGLLGLCRTLAREVGRRGIRVNAVLPGFVATDMTAPLTPAEVERLRSRECLPGGTSPRHVAEAVSFLLSERAAAITGQALLVDAGSSV